MSGTALDPRTAPAFPMGNPWALREIVEGESFRPSREEVVLALSLRQRGLAERRRLRPRPRAHGRRPRRGI